MQKCRYNISSAVASLMGEGSDGEGPPPLLEPATVSADFVNFGGHVPRSTNPLYAGPEPQGAAGPAAAPPRRAWYEGCAVGHMVICR